MPVPRTRVAAPAPPPVVSYRAASLPSGRLMPIEVRIGRRLLRTIPPESAEARKLLQDGRVEVVALVGGRMPPAPRDH